MAGSTTLRALRDKLDSLEGHVLPDRAAGREGPEVLSTGIDRLDRFLPGGGIPRGRTTEWRGPRSCGKAALLRAALERRCAAGDSVAWVDVGRTLHAPDWVPLARSPGRFWVVRPSRSEEGGWCADLLLRSGAFDVVVLEGGAPGSALRLQRLARDAGAALVVMDRLPVAALRLRFHPGRIEPVDGRFGPVLPPLRPLWVRVRGREEMELPVLCPAPGDRTGVVPARDRKGRR